METTKKIILISVIAIIGVLAVFLALILIGNFAYTNAEITQQQAQQIAEQRVTIDYNYRNLGGHDLVLTGAESCGAGCYTFTYEYDVGQTEITNLDKIESSVTVKGGHAGNFTYTEIMHDINNYQECVDAGHEVLYPDCAGCSPYCETPGGRKFEKQETEKYIVDFADSRLYYNFTVNKPTPCHEIFVDEQIMESYPVQVRIDVQVRDSGGMCAQVIQPENVTGVLDLGETPGRVTVVVDGTQVYARDFDVCTDQCGDGNCDEMVCMGTGCPCAETPDSCPEDCA